jgi:hypothetical protein
MIASVALLATGLAGCSKDLSRDRAANLIQQNQDFNFVISVKVPVGNLWWDWRDVNDLVSQYRLQTLMDRGIITMRESGQKSGYWSKEFVTELTPKGKELCKNWIATNEKMPDGAPWMNSNCWTTWGNGEPCHPARGVVYSVVLAHRSAIQVTGITSDPGGTQSEAVFNWEWPPTPNASNFPGTVPGGIENGQAAFQLYDDGWRLTQIAWQ